MVIMMIIIMMMTTMAAESEAPTQNGKGDGQFVVLGVTTFLS
jgi:hypothetical protein